MAYNLLSIFIQAFKAANPAINVEEGYPVYDTMLNPNSKAFTAMDGIVNMLEDNLDYANFFDEDGILKSNDKFDILKSNLFLGNGMAVRGRATLILEFSTLKSEVVITEGVTVTREDITFKVPAGAYTLPVYSVAGTKIRYAIPIVSEDIGEDIPTITAGGWTVSTGSLPADCTRSYTDYVSSVGVGNAGILTQDNVRLLMSNNALNTTNSILTAVNSAALNAGVIPDRTSVVGYSDPEYQSGVVPFEDEAEDVKVFRFGGYVDVRVHEGMEVKEFYFEDGEVYADGLYRYYFESPVYAVVESRTWVTGSMGAPLPFTFDYVNNAIITNSRNIRVSVVTTSALLWTFMNSTIKSLKSSSGTIKLLPYYSVRFFVDSTCVDAAEASMVGALNEALLAIFDEGGDIDSLEFDTVSKALFEATGVIVTNIKYYVPDDGVGAAPQDFVAGSFPVITIEYGPSNLPVELTLTKKNTVCCGGYQGVYGG